MGFLFTVVYIITAYLAPITVWGDLANYHVEIFIAVLALLFSAFSASGSNVLKLPASWAIFGLTFAVAMSHIGNKWIGGAPIALENFVPDVITFFLIVMNCKKKWHLQVLALTLFLCAAFTIYRADQDIAAGLNFTDYVINMRVSEDTSDRFHRIKGRSFLGDPNDFAQFMVSLIPLMFLMWSKRAAIRNFILVYVPCGVLMYGMYETHSRGSMVALMASTAIAFRKKLGVIPSIIGGVLVFAALTAAGYSGGRDVAAGEDRLGAWSTGLLLIRSHPIFGVGFQRFVDYNDITAHNTFIVCAAELGLLGVFFWIMLTFITVRNAWETAKTPDEHAEDAQKRIEAAEAKQPFLQGIPTLTEAAVGSGQGQQFAGAGAPFILPPEVAADFAGGSGANYPGFSIKEKEEDAAEKDAEIRRMSALMVVCFAGFLTAGWFLSRAYTMCLYVNAGMAAAVYRMAQDRGIAPPQPTFGEASKSAGKIIFVLLAVVWIIVHIDHYMPK